MSAKPPEHGARRSLSRRESIERSHRIDAEAFYWLLDGLVIDDAKVFNDKLQEWGVRPQRAPDVL